MVLCCLLGRCQDCDRHVCRKENDGVVCVCVVERVFLDTVVVVAA